MTPITDVAPLARHVYHLFFVRVAGRDSAQAELARRGIQTGVHPVPCHRQPPVQQFAHRAMAVAERAAGEVLSLPMFADSASAGPYRLTGGRATKEISP
jgi:dTDP-4-amino-4,6-dideoxygalactose transaminase